MAQKVILRVPTNASAMEEGNPLPISTKGTVQRILLKRAGIDSGEAVPLPDYMSPQSRLAYVQSIRNKYGASMQGRGDTILNVNEIPRGGSSSAKNIATAIGKKYGIDPALLYSSAMEEGMSGLFKSRATGLDTRNRKPTEIGYQDFYGDKEYPVNAEYSLGLGTITERLPDLIRKGYLPKDFAKNMRGAANEGAYNKADFKNVESALEAKAALMKSIYDHVDSFSKTKGIKLSPKARDFFALAEYNGGEGAIYNRMMDYHRSGALQGDRFLETRPKFDESVKDTYKDVYGHVIPRMKMAETLKKERLFDDETQQQAISNIFKNPSGKVLLKVGK